MMDLCNTFLKVFTINKKNNFNQNIIFISALHMQVIIAMTSLNKKKLFFSCSQEQ